jgi:23S rRNA (cytosine1962-C5)-methyltransferase
VAVIHADSASLADAWVPSLRFDLASFCQTAYLKIHPLASTPLSEEQRRRLAPDEPVWGSASERVEVVEVGVGYEVRPAAGLSAGLFLDMREVRQWLNSACGGRAVLNLFAYTCSLGVCAALGGAERVVNVDISRPYLEWGKANYALNGLAVEERDFIYGDAFDWLSRFARRRQAFDVVVVDPPSFSSTPFSVTRDYPRLVAAAARVVAPGGVLLAATNHAQTSDARFDAWLREGLSQAARRGISVARWHEPSIDFPVPRGERPYLKVRALELS